MMFQSYALFPHLTVLDNVAFALKMRGMGKADRHAKAAQLLRLVAMEALRRAPAGAALGRAAAARGAGPRAHHRAPGPAPRRAALRARSVPAHQDAGGAEALQRELGMTFVHVTHAQDEAMALADLVVVMNGGRIEQQGTPREVFNRPRTEFVARFIGGHNVVAVGGTSSPCARTGCGCRRGSRRRADATRAGRPR